MNISTLKIGNAAGVVKSVADVELFAACGVNSEITVGSITVEKRAGNAEPREHLGEHGYFNSLGLPNEGLDWYENHLPEMRKIAWSKNKELRLSIAGFSPREYGELARMAKMVAHTVEINLGCPNAWSAGEQKRIASFDTKLIEDIIQVVSDALYDTGDRFPHLAVKVSPYSDPGKLTEVAQLFSKNRYVESVVLSNTFPNALPLKASGGRAISGLGYAGMSGPSMREIVLGQVAQFRTLLPGRISITAVGGISSGTDIRDFFIAGASDFQVGTECYLKGPKALQSIVEEYASLE